jgi:hypothetical protein
MSLISARYLLVASSLRTNYADKAEYTLNLASHRGRARIISYLASMKTPPQQAAGYQREMHSDEKPRFLKLFPLSGNPIASYGES